jgi:hypothetical protein
VASADLEAASAESAKAIAAVCANNGAGMESAFEAWVQCGVPMPPPPPPPAPAIDIGLI